MLTTTVTLLSKVILLSATMPTDVLEVTNKFMREPIRILVKKEQLTLEGTQDSLRIPANLSYLKARTVIDVPFVTLCIALQVSNSSTSAWSGRSGSWTRSAISTRR